MPAAVNFVLTDNASVQHTYVPRGPIGDGKGTLRWVEQNALNPAASSYITLLQRGLPANADMTVRGNKVPMREVSFRFGKYVTFVDADTGLTMVDYPMWFAGVFGLPARMTSAEGTDMSVLVRSVQNSSALIASISSDLTIY